MLPKLPDPVANYLKAEKSKDADAIALCFAEDGAVHDEGEDHKGRAAIRRWKQEADAKYSYVLEPLSANVDKDTVILRARLEGNFPGSPVELDHVFRIANGKIASLEIG
jgi:ketosteroid isomerase-like protein